MILTEQMYKNLYRPYYHGQRYKDRDKTKALFSCYYLSTDPYYAYQYSGSDGYIKVQYEENSNLLIAENLYNVDQFKDIIYV